LIKNSTIKSNRVVEEEERIMMRDWDWLIGLAVLAVWLVLMLVVFPKLGVPT
jgi:hypothetical protein